MPPDAATTTCRALHSEELLANVLLLQIPLRLNKKAEFSTAHARIGWLTDTPTPHHLSAHGRDAGFSHSSPRPGQIGVREPMPNTLRVDTLVGGSWDLESC